MNSKLFHKVASERKRKSLIKKLEFREGKLVRESGAIADKITRFYKALYSEENQSRPFLEGLDWCAISHEKAAFLERPSEEEEIRRAIWCMDKDKAPSPDGFTTGFFQDCWDVIKADLMKVFEEFHRNGKIGVNINSTFITLAPKKDRSVKDYRPISLVTNLYKIIIEILSICLSVVLGDTISKNQSAFVADRQILDATLIANEVVDDMRKWSKQCLAFKLDFEKAYDRVSWSFLDKALEFQV